MLLLGRLKVLGRSILPVVRRAALVPRVDPTEQRLGREPLPVEVERAAFVRRERVAVRE